MTKHALKLALSISLIATLGSACGDDPEPPPEPDLAKVTTVQDLLDPDDGEVSLREAVLYVQEEGNEGEVITFGDDVTGTITLTAGSFELGAGKEVTIEGPSRQGLVIDAGGKSQLFLSNGAKLSLKALTLKGGVAPQSAKGGGAIEANGGSLTLEDVEVSSSSSALGGGIYIGEGTTYGMTNVLLKENTSTGDGGGVYDAGQAAGPLSQVTFEGNTATKNGGALFLVNNDATLTSATFTGNKAERGGAVVTQFKEGTLTLTDGAFNGNEASKDAGAIWLRQLDSSVRNEGVVLKLEKTQLEGNKALDGSGGAVVAEALTLIETSEATFTSNSATASGGAIATQGSLLLDQSTFSQNSASADKSQGGAIAATSESEKNSVKIVGGSFAQNSAFFGGALFSESAARIDIEGVTFDKNEATGGDGGALNVAKTKESIFRIGTITMTENKANSGRGGAIFTTEPLTVEGGEMSANSAEFGGAIFAQQVALVLRNGVKITGNVATGDGGGVYNNGTSATVKLEGGATVSGNTKNDFLQPELVD